MALIHFEGFENREPLGRAEMAYSATASPIFVTGRSTGSALTTNNTSSSSNGSVIFNHGVSNNATFVVSGAFRPTRLLNSTLLIAINNEVGPNARLSVSSTGQIQIEGASASPTASSAYTLVVGEWARIDLVASCAQSPNGWVQAWVNGVMVAELTGLDTLGGTGYTNGGSFAYGLGAARTGWSTWEVDDVYMLTNNGAAPTARLGDVRIETIVPTGNGTHSEFGGSDGNSVDNWALVDELPASATDYVTGAAGSRDLYQMANLTIPAGVVHAVQTHMLSSKTDTGAAELVPMVRLDGVTQELAPVGLGVAAVYSRSEIKTTDPSGAPWSVAKVNSAEFGIKAT